MTRPRRASPFIARVPVFVLWAGVVLSASAATVAKPGGAPLTLMVVYEGSGPTASPEVAEGAIAAANAINASGGIKGRPVEIITCDTKNDPNVAAECGRKAVSEGIVAMVGNLTLYGSQFMPLMAKHKIASIGLEPTTAADFTSPASFPSEGGAPVNFAGLAATLAESGAKKIVLARVDIPQAAAVAQFVNAGLKRFHLKMRDVPIPVGAPDMSPYAAAALKDGTDGVVVTETDQDAVNFVVAVRQVNPKIKIALISNSLAEVIRALGKDGEGIIETASETIALKNRAERQYEKDMKAAGYSDVTGFRLASYAGVQLLRTVAQRLPRITAPAVFNALHEARNVTTGFTPPLQFMTGGVAGLPRVFNACMLSMRIMDGKPVPITGKFENAFTGKECATPR